MPKSILAKAAEKFLGKTLKRSHLAAEDVAAEFQRVHSYIADCAKDASVLYAKLARLQGDFRGEELETLIKVSESVLSISSDLQSFSKNFSEGRFETVENPYAGGFDYSQSAQPFDSSDSSDSSAPPPAPPPAPQKKSDGEEKKDSSEDDDAKDVEEVEDNDDDDVDDYSGADRD